MENDNCDRLTEAMERILAKDKDTYDQMCVRSTELFEENFLDQRVAAEFDAFYKELIKGEK